MSVSYFIIYPGGRVKINPTPENNSEAEKVFREHWTATATYFVPHPRRKLVREVREELAVEYLSVAAGG